MVVLDRHGPKMHPVATTGSRSILVPAITDARAKPFPIGELSKHSGVNIETIRYYERAKMLAPPPRTASGRRVYGSMDLRILVFIRRSRELGFSLGQIRTLLRLGGLERATCREVREIATHHLDDIRAFEDLKKLERLLSKTVARCTGKTAPECPVLDVLDIERQK
jgi:MerR family transcriptional regulator, mercuric resistance operon regulatory protein